MDNITLREVQLAELNILCDVSKMCEENNIKYFLSGGTLIGAIRHGGFIPWDDDIDIGMLRPEFEKFRTIAQEKLGEKYFVQSWYSDPEFPFASIKVRKLGTLYKEASSVHTRFHSELFIDVFPYDNYPEHKENQVCQGNHIDKYRKILMMKAGMTPWKMSTDKVKRVGVYLKNLPFVVSSRFSNKKEIMEKYNTHMTLYNNMETLCVFEECNGTNYGKFVVPRKCIGDLKRIQFEGHFYYGPEDPDLYLKSIYGNYMELPPVEKRVNHSVVEVKL